MNFTLPKNYNSLAGALVDLFGTSIAITDTERLSGGDINKAYGLSLNNGQHVFMKANAKANAAFFTAEAAGLTAIANTKAIKTPDILCTGTDDLSPAHTHAAPDDSQPHSSAPRPGAHDSRPCTAVCSRNSSRSQ